MAEARAELALGVTRVYGAVLQAAAAGKAAEGAVDAARSRVMRRLRDQIAQWELQDDDAHESL